MADLGELGPPREDAEAGYYPDPLGGRWARWWDGRQWTQTVGPRADPSDPADAPVPPPTRVCRRCAARTETFARECPNCGRPYGQPAAWQVIAISLASLLLIVGGCGACVLVGVKEAEQELERHSISRGEFRSVKPGTPQARVEDELGEPLSRDRVNGRPCITYEEEGGDLLDLRFFELCFENGTLASKDAY